jgi:hypothetical protein
MSLHLSREGLSRLKPCPSQGKVRAVITWVGLKEIEQIFNLMLHHYQASLSYQVAAEPLTTLDSGHVPCLRKVMLLHTIV